MDLVYKAIFQVIKYARVLIVEAFGQAAAALTACGIDPKEYDNKLVYLMGVDKARFRSPVPDCELI